ncbi:MAG: hypothetical protein IPJ89_04080 [Candidatus Iainarchaeum archaeon]|uniref:Glycosyltransferase family 2 protein n=1 Tax=Candidatus Iainarchaeum sp. TaxID=3101447 RepID=A0A7T9DJ79_9ARCH|nr:MAG: hypothetical protein IPJ89_04080 [Candidatus Diapherotrites archaeon]
MNEIVSKNVPKTFDNSFIKNEGLPKILLGCPTHQYKADSLKAYFEGIESLTYPHFDVVLEDNSPTPNYSEKLKQLAKQWEEKHPGRSFRVIYSGETSPKGRARLVHGRNLIRDMVLKENYDYFLSLEQDVVPPTDIIERFLAHQKEFVSGVYWNKELASPAAQPKLVVMAGTYANDEDKQKKLVRSVGMLQLLPSRLIEVAYTGLGCALISRRLLEKIPFRYDEKQLACDDVYFCLDAEALGEKIYLDSSVWCAHHFNDAFRKTEY